MLEMISNPWHWSVSGLAIAGVMFALLFAGKEFGVSANLRTLCAVAGAGRHSDFFRLDWRAQRWNLLFVGGAVIGGYLAYFVFPADAAVTISDETVRYLAAQGVRAPGSTGRFSPFVPAELFAADQIFTLRGLVVLVVGGFLIGFGTRWAGGCTSGHAISGLANLQLPSLIAVVGFFLGGLLMTWFLLPLILRL